MKEEFQVITEKKAETAILVGIITQDQDERKTTEYLDELEFLADTAGVRVMRRFTQKIPQALAATYVGKGKLEEMRDYIKRMEDMENEVGMAIFDDELTAKQMSAIESVLGVKVLDRTSLILDIFAMRAQTAHAKTQVELAQYRYLPACSECGPTWSVRAVVPVPAAERVPLVFADPVRPSLRWTAE